MHRLAAWRLNRLLLGICTGAMVLLLLGLWIHLGLREPGHQRLAVQSLLALVSLSAGGATVYAAWQTARRSRPEAWAWRAFAAAQCVSFTGFGVAASWGLIDTGRSPPAEAFFLGQSVLLLLGVGLLPTSSASRLERVHGFLDGLVVTLSVAWLIWFFWSGGTAATSFQRQIPAAYLVGALATAWAVAAAIFRPLEPGVRRPALILALSAGVLSAADLASAHQAALGADQAAGLVTLAYLVRAGLVWLASALQGAAAAAAREAPPSTAPPVRPAFVRLGLPSLGAAGACALLFVAAAETRAGEQPMPSAGLTLAAAGVIGLVLARQLVGRAAAEAELRRLNSALEQQLERQAQALQRAHQTLWEEIAERRRVEAALRRSEAQLAYEAFHDALTGLPNRALFSDRLERSLERARRNGQYRFAVLFLDCDGFKLVNDSLGHPVGDQLLQEVACRLQGCLRSADTVARLGGDEFAVLLEDVRHEADVTQAAERVQAALGEAFSLEGHTFFASASLGIVLSEPAYERPDDILRDADVAMYVAKQAGKARHAIFDASMRAKAIARLNLENDLRAAFDQQAFYLHYQPILDLRQRRLAGFEALLRWSHPHLGPIAPADFLPVAEETGLIVPLGEWVLREACRQLRAWQARFPFEPLLTVSVNLSARQLKRPGLARQVADLLRELELEPRSLKLEVTESAIIDDAAGVAATLAELRALGVQVQIDDFGTGYSSLSYLYRFPIDALKIDRTFVSRIGAGGENAEFVRTIAALAHELGLSVVAEGVETRDQITAIEAVGCEQAQGYLVSQPLDSAQAAQFISEQRLWEKPVTA